MLSHPKFVKNTFQQVNCGRFETDTETLRSSFRLSPKGSQCSNQKNMSLFLISDTHVFKSFNLRNAKQLTFINKRTKLRVWYHFYRASHFPSSPFRFSFFIHMHKYICFSFFMAALTVSWRLWFISGNWTDDINKLSRSALCPPGWCLIAAEPTCTLAHVGFCLAANNYNISCLTLR